MFLSFLFSKRAPELAGKWVDADASTHGAEYGFILMNGGTARSVNAASPQYTAWRNNGGTLTLWGRARGADNSDIEFIESLKIHRVTEHELVLGRADETYTFTRG